MENETISAEAAAGGEMPEKKKRARTKKSKVEALDGFMKKKAARKTAVKNKEAESATAPEKALEEEFLGAPKTLAEEIAPAIKQLAARENKIAEPSEKQAPQDKALIKPTEKPLTEKESRFIAEKSSPLSPAVGAFYEKKTEPTISELAKQAGRGKAAENLAQSEAIKEEEEVVDAEGEKGRKILKVGLSVLAIAFVLGLLGSAGFFYYKYRAVMKSGNPAEKETEKYISAIGKFMVLPEGEEPTLATVADKDKLSGQAFFRNARNGDKVLLFAKGQKAVLYRPAENKIIEVMMTTSAEQLPAPAPGAETTVNVGNPGAEKTEESAEEAPQTAKVAVYNGTNVKGLAKSVGDKIAEIAGVTVAEKTNAKGTFEKTIVVNLSGKHNEFARKITEELGGEVGAMPEDETRSEADILIIAGSNVKI